MHAEPLEPRLALSATAYDVIGLPAEQATYGLTGAGYNVALIDTGTDTTQADYRGGWNFISNNANPADDNGHGTFVADELHHMAPDAGIYALKALDATGTGTLATIDLALKWVEAHYQQDKIVAVNLSLGAPGATDDADLDADVRTLLADGLVIVAAAGNDQATHPNTLDTPARLPGVFSVGATYAGSYGSITEDKATDYVTYPDKIAAFSQRSADLDLLAPGAFLASSYGTTWAGTSMSTPLVTGASVLVRQALDQRHEPAIAADILAVLRQTGMPVADTDPGQDNVSHTGAVFPRLDVANAVASVLGPPSEPTPSTPVNPAPNAPTNGSYVASVYRHVLGREPEPAGLDYWLKAMNQGASRMDVAKAIWRSPEHLARYAVETTEQLYESLLDRPGDPGGLATFAHVSEDATAEIMLASNEFWRASAGG